MSESVRTEPLQNRVDPWGKLRSVRSKGTLMGNRGKLHNSQKAIVRAWRDEAWIACTLDVQKWGKRPQMMMPNSYTELFFLDEATAFAAGHRPCAQCRRGRYNDFQAAWASAYSTSAKPSAAEMDTRLQAARLDDQGEKKTWSSKLRDLPDGTMFTTGSEAFLVWAARQWRWSFDGYQAATQPVSGDEMVLVLTPEPIVRLLSFGMTVQVHDSVNC
ncbi:hypothetical protein ACFPU0_03195 [Pseudomonas sp. GCM10022186]|uniref:hypothetical protein n=1 Tax=Pseudomonas sp. GCM10022186 TaxID=3252650 RepID=UPI00361837CF